MHSGEGNGNPLQYPCLDNSMDGGAWQATGHGAAESDTTERLHFLSLYSSFWRREWHPLQRSCLESPWTEGPGGLRSMGLKRVGHD